MDRQSFMDFFRDEFFHDKVSDDDCIEIFLTVLKGSSDITKELLESLCKDYGLNLRNLLDNEVLAWR